eukprot:6300515-Prymnesium_polylepis.1
MSAESARTSVEESFELTEYNVSVLFDRGRRLVRMANRGASVGYSMRKHAGSLARARKRHAAQRQAEVVEKNEGRQATDQAWAAMRKKRDEIQTEHIAQMERYGALVGLRCDQVLPHGLAREQREAISSMLGVVVHMNGKLSLADVGFSLTLKGLFTSSVEREVRLARLEMDEEVEVTAYHHRTQVRESQSARGCCCCITAACRRRSRAHPPLDRVALEHAAPVASLARRARITPASRAYGGRGVRSCAVSQVQQARVAAKVVYAAMRWLTYARHKSLKRSLYEA